ncbi:MAG: hypothetical protein ACR2KZ_18850, partial [Segetibacter sp.]
TRPYRVHDFEQLLILSGVYLEFRNELSSNATFKLKWSIVSEWTENSRYLAGISPERVKKFITLIKEFMGWIQKHL